MDIVPTAQILTWIQSVEEAIRWFNNAPDLPDLIFLDIQLSDGNSFEIFDAVQVDTPIIFTTAYNQYALDAFKVHSIDYLLKPISKKKLQSAIQKYQSIVQQPQLDYQALKQLLQSAHQQVRYKERYLVKQGSRLFSIPTKSIAYFYSDELTFLVGFDQQKFILNTTLDQIEKETNPKTFFRLNRKVIAHIDAIEQIDRRSDTKLKIYLHPPSAFEIMVSKEKAGRFKAWLNL